MKQFIETIVGVYLKSYSVNIITEAKAIEAVYFIDIVREDGSKREERREIVKLYENKPTLEDKKVMDALVEAKVLWLKQEMAGFGEGLVDPELNN